MTADTDQERLTGRPAEEVAEAYGLRRVGRRPPLATYLRALWRYRHFTIELARSRFVARNQSHRLGMFWTVLRPSMQAAVYAFVFGLLFAGNRPENWIAYVATGVFVFGFTSQTARQGAQAVTGDLALVRALRFPRAVLPTSITLIELFSTMPAVAVLVVVVFVTGVPASWQWFLVVPALALQTAFNQGVAFACARLTTHVHDFTQVLPFGLRAVFYLSAVFYEISRLPGAVAAVLAYNPVYIYISLVRGALLDSVSTSPRNWLMGGAWAVTSLVAGLHFFWRGEERYGRG